MQKTTLKNRIPHCHPGEGRGPSYCPKRNWIPVLHRNVKTRELFEVLRGTSAMPLQTIPAISFDLLHILTIRCAASGLLIRAYLSVPIAF